MRYFTSIILGICTSILLVWLMVHLIDQQIPQILVEPEKSYKVDLAKIIEEPISQPSKSKETKPHHPKEVPELAISNTQQSDHQVSVKPVLATMSNPITHKVNVDLPKGTMPSLPGVNGRDGLRAQVEIERKYPVDYPHVALREGIEGYVVIENTIDENGNVIKVTVIESSHKEFISAVKKSARLWKYVSSEQLNRKHRTRVAFNLEN